MLFMSQGPAPLDAAPPMTRDEVTNYVEGLAALLMEVARSGGAEAADAARAVLPRSVATSAFYARPGIAVERLGTMVEWALIQEVPVPVSDLAFQLQRVRDGLGRLESDTGTEIRKAVEDIESLIERLDSGSFPVRLKRLAGDWSLEDYKYEVDEHGHNLERGTRKLRDLAREVVENPEELTNELLSWLCSPEAEKGDVFFWQLGKLDREQRWLATVERLGSRDEGAIIFGAYLGGFADHDRALVEDQLDELAEAQRVADRAILWATSQLGGSCRGIERIEKLLVEGRLEPALIGRTLTGRWTEPLEAGAFLRLLCLLAGPGLKNAIVAVRVAVSWEHMGKPLEGELADFVWRCLETARSDSHTDDYELDRLAAVLAHRDPAKGFRLLEALLTRADEVGWEPISDHHENQLWGALREADCERAIRLVVSLAVAEGSRIIGISQALQGTLGQQTNHDLLVSLTTEDERQAEIIANSITAAEAGFWPLAVEILAQYPENQVV